MKNLSKLLAVVFLLPFFMSAQDAADKKYTMVELSYMKVKIGSEKKFEDAVKAHNEKYHKDGSYASQLYSVTTGSETGWYVWTMGSMTFTELDGRPTGEEHGKDWNKTIAPYIEEYGRVEYWRKSEKLSNSKDDNEKMIILWWIDVNRGDYRKIKPFLENIASLYKKNDDEMNTYDNQFPQGDGRDIVLVWPLNSWADMDKDDWKLKEQYEEEHGESAWDDAVEDWENATKSVVQEVWTVVE